MARAKFVATKDQRQLVEILAAMGTPQDEICLQVLNPENGRPIGEVQLRRHFRHELDTAMTRANAKVGGTLFKMAVSGEHVAATIFWMKSRAKWRETNVTEHTGKGGSAIQVQAVPYDLTKLNRDELEAFEVLLRKALPEPP